MLTMQGIKGGNPEVACQAIEFWSTVCDEEYEILEDEDSDRLFLFSYSLCFSIFLYFGVFISGGLLFGSYI